MNRIVYSFLLILFLGMSNISVCAEGTQPSVGNGTPANPYQIGTADELVWFRDFVNQGGDNLSACAELTADIDLSGIDNWTPISKTTYWTGSFDGKGNRITALSINTNDDITVGLFGLVNGTIKNLSVSGTVVKNSTNGAGILFGKGGASSNILNCTVEGSVTSVNKAGGFCSTTSGSFTNCINKANIQVNYGDVGGIASSGGNLTGCINYGNITSTAGCTAGGLIGSIISNTTITNSGNIGNLTLQGKSLAGSMIGNWGNCTLTISNSFNYGNISSANKDSKIGYFIGSTSKSSFSIFNNVYFNSNATYKKSDTNVSYAIGSHSTSTISPSPISATSTDFTSGKVCYLLNGDQSTINWYQTIGTDDCPTPIGNTNSTVYRVAVNAGEKFVNENGTIAQITFTDGEDFITPVAFTITDAQYSRAMTNNWGTLCLPYALNTSECSGVEFYEISSVSNESITLTQITGVIDAGKPVFYLKPTGAASVNFNATNAVIQPTAGTTTESISHWNTIGTYTNQSITDNTNAYYFVASDKIYPKEPSRALTVKPFRAYLSAPSNAGARQFSIEVMGETTAVNALNSLNDDNVQIYDINGIRKSSLSKGINIINGKKIIIR